MADTYQEGASYRPKRGRAYVELRGTGLEPRLSRLNAGESFQPTLEVWEANQDALERADADVDATDGALEAAAALGVDLETVKGTGSGGRITKPDVERTAGS